MTLHHYLFVGAVLFVLGLVGFLTRRNMILMFLCAEMMLQGVAINFLAFARYHGNWQGQSFVLFMLTVAACEAAIALAVILMLYRKRHTLDVSVWQDLREPDQEPMVDEEPLPTPAPQEKWPKLPEAGRQPEKTEEVTRV